MTAPAHTIIRRLPETAEYVHELLAVQCSESAGYHSSRVNAAALTVFVALVTADDAVLWAKVIGGDAEEAQASGGALLWEFDHRGWAWTLTARDPRFLPVQPTSPPSRCGVCDRPML